jgi:hypothetical protein
VKSKSLLLLLPLTLGAVSFTSAASHYGNYLPERLGVAKDEASDALLFQGDRELLYDFDGPKPLAGVEFKDGKGDLSRLFRMSGPQALYWQPKPGGEVSFAAGLTLRKSGKGFAFSASYRLTLGLFLPSRQASPPAFRAELLGADGAVLFQVPFYLHRAGWNILDVQPGLQEKTRIERIRLVAVGPGPLPAVLVDNVMLFLSPRRSIAVATAGILDAQTASERLARTTPLAAVTPEEQAAFRTIAERVVPPVTAVASLPESKVAAFEAWRDSWKIQRQGAFANGRFPLYYYRAVPGDLVTDSSSSRMYQENQTFCGKLGELGRAYAACEDAAQKARLRSCLVDMVRLALTFGGMPNAWYNGRGFAEGVYHGRDALAAEGLLEPVSLQILQQYGVDRILGQKPVWEQPPLGTGESLSPAGVEFQWSSSADDLNTGVQSTFLTVLIGPDGPTKAERLRRLSAFYSRIALNYAPQNNGTLKPDGSWFHHWGNRFDNYGWQSAFRGASEALYWFSGTPFRIEPEAEQRLQRMADVYQQVAFADGSVGPPDNHQPAGRMRETILANLAKGGLPVGANESAQPPVAPDALVSMSYAGMQIRRQGDWALYLRGTSQHFYHTQYTRYGFLFHTIGGLGLVRQGHAHAMWGNADKVNLAGRHDPTSQWVTAGYHPSYAPVVTAIEAPWSELGQLYYQRGTHDAVGGVALGRSGVFVQPFDARLNKGAFGKTVSKDLAFRKTYFTFDRQVVALGRDLRAGAGQRVVTGILQERAEADAPGITLGKPELSWTQLAAGVPSERVNWAQTRDGSLGVWLFPGQTVRGETGPQEVAGRTGEISRLYLDHGAELAAGQGSYGLIYTVQPEPGVMAGFAAAMAGSNPPIRILADVATLQVVEARQGAETATGYACHAAGAITAVGPVAQVDAPCLLMTRAAAGGKTLQLAVADPDIHMERTAANPFGWSVPTPIVVTLNGAWTLQQAVAVRGIKPPQVQVDAPRDGQTVVRVTVVDGLGTELRLVAR